jgi:hypothetical protein
MVYSCLRVGRRMIHHRDTENTEGAQRKLFNPLCYLCVLCVSVVSYSLPTQSLKLGLDVVLYSSENYWKRGIK